MGKAGPAKEKKEQKRKIKDKKKFQGRNQIGKRKKKTGDAGKYVTRTQAVAKLQVPLKDFRKLCILKGVYPREPKKVKNSNTTYFFAKDIAFLMHEPLLNKFREQKAFLKKIRKASGRHERKLATKLDERKPLYKLDHLIRERYPTFVDALQDIDDALCLVSLFASLSPSNYVPAARVASCSRLRREFLAYVARTNCLRHTFISIKGIYYQAEVQGVKLTWVEPHGSFAQQPTMTVDYRVMLSFLELYEAVLTFVNFKLYHDLGVTYPPPLDSKADNAGVHLGASLFVLSKKQLTPPTLMPSNPITDASQTSGKEGTGNKPSAATLASLRGVLATVDRAGTADADGKGAAGPGKDEGGAADDVPMGEDADEPEASVLRGLFSSCNFFCGRETPVAALEFLILACGGRVGWEGEASPFGAMDACVTHQIVDRPVAPSVSDERLAATRAFVQPQWVFDCINARSLVATHPYRPGVICPAHLSPFGGGSEGYNPADRLALTAAAAAAAEEEEEEEEEEVDGEESDDAGGEEDEDDEDEDEDEDEEESDEGEEAATAAEYASELASEIGGGGSKGKSGRAKAAAAAAAQKGGKAAEMSEEKALALMMMPRKKRRLYDRMQHGIQKREAAADVLRSKRAALDAEAGAKTGAGAKRGKKGASPK
jgi:pescadillo protein